MKSDKLKKYELELKDLEQWLKLGLVPKKDLDKHNAEITALRNKIDDEYERLRFLKESGDLEGYTPPRKPTRVSSYTDSQTLPNIDNQNDTTSSGLTDAGLDMQTEATESGTSVADTTEKGVEDDTSFDGEEDPFSDNNRWRRGILDPEAADDNW